METDSDAVLREQLIEAIHAVTESLRALAAPTRYIRDPDGTIVGTEAMLSGKNEK